MLERGEVPFRPVWLVESLLVWVEDLFQKVAFLDSEDEDEVSGLLVVESAVVAHFVVGIDVVDNGPVLNRLMDDLRLGRHHRELRLAVALINREIILLIRHLGHFFLQVDPTKLLHVIRIALRRLFRQRIPIVVILRLRM